MRYLVCQQHLSPGGGRIEPSGTEDYVPIHRERAGVQLVGDRGGSRVGMDHDVSCWHSEPRLHVRACVPVQSAPGAGRWGIPR